MIRLKRLAGAVLCICLTAPATRGQDQAAPQSPPPTPGARRSSPPQPQQQQGLEYFAGSWAFTWTGRESTLTAGPRTGTVTFTRIGTSNFMDVVSTGKADTGAAFQESGTLGWNDGRKVIALHERLGNGSEVLSIGDWSSPLSIRFDSSPIRVQNQTIRLRRVYAILSAQSFSIVEEIAIDNGSFQRLGNGEFIKSAAP
jgi:hypothetical protein